MRLLRHMAVHVAVAFAAMVSFEQSRALPTSNHAQSAAPLRELQYEPF
jgi:hypothetical protein